MFYTGSKAHQVKHGDGEFPLQPYERETLTMTVQPEEYMPKTVEYCHFMWVKTIRLYSYRTLILKMQWLLEVALALEIMFRFNSDALRFKKKLPANPISILIR